MRDASAEAPDQFIRDIDAMGRAVFTWVRQQVMEQRFLGVRVTDAEQCQLAAGFLAGLRARLSLGDTESTLVAYAYALMRGERHEAARSVRELMARDAAASMSCSGYLQGLQAARRLFAEPGGAAQPEAQRAPAFLDRSALN